MAQQNYLRKFIILFIATIAAIFAIWYAMIRQESADWITGQVVHQTSPYIVANLNDGTVIIDNVVAGYEISLPKGFKTNGARNLIFYLEEGGRKKCLIRHQAKNLVFELVDDKEKDVCGRYLNEIKNSLQLF